MNQYKILTVTHKQVPVEDLGRYIVPEEKGTPAYVASLQALKSTLQLDELMYLNTCNRVTYFFTTQQSVGDGFSTRFFKTLNTDFEACNAVNARVFEGKDAIEHLCEMGASLDSMVLGEREIIRQLRVAYEDAQGHHLTGDDIRLAMKFVIPAAKKIFTETRIAEKPISVVSLASLRLRDLQVPQNARFILIGAGETIQSMAAYLVDMGYSRFAIFNRTHANAVKLAEKINGKAYSLADLENYHDGFDVIITSTGSAKQEISLPVYAQLLSGDTNRKIIIDLAVPADTDAAIVQQYAVEYISIDDLRVVAQKNLASRKSEVVKAKQLVHEFVKEFQSAYMERMVEKAHSIIPVRLHEIRLRAIEEVYAKEYGKLDPQSKETVSKLLDYIEKKYIALTMASSKEAMHGKHPSSHA